MNKTKSAILIVFILILLVFLGAIAWKYHGVIAQEKTSQQEASIASTISSLTEAVSSGTTTSSLQSLGSAVSSSPSSVTNIDDDASPSVVSQITIVPQSGWTTYDEGEYAVAGTYPQAWYEYDAIPLGGSLQFTSIPNSAATTGGMIVSGVGEIVIYRTPETLTQAQAEDSLNGTQDAETTSNIAGESVPVIGYTLTSSSENSMVAYVSHNGYVYRIVLTYHGEPQFSAIYSNFLATFEFTN